MTVHHPVLRARVAILASLSVLLAGPLLCQAPTNTEVSFSWRRSAMDSARRWPGRDLQSGARSTTFRDRLAWAFIGGGATALVTAGLTSTSGPDWAPIAGYVAGSAAGVILVTEGNEGARPLHAFGGALVGVSVGGLYLALAPTTTEGLSLEQVVAVAIMALATPVGAAAF